MFYALSSYILYCLHFCLIVCSFVNCLLSAHLCVYVNEAAHVNLALINENDDDDDGDDDDDEMTRLYRVGQKNGATDS